jgi:hypothetical protein
VNESVASRPAVADLSFHVYDRTIHPEWINSFQTRVVEAVDFKLVAHLTAAGHVLQWIQGKSCLTEVVSAQVDELPEAGELFRHRISGERTESLRPFDHVAYRTCFQVERLAPVVFFRVHDEICFDAEKSGVFFKFRQNDRLRLSPVGYLDLQSRPGSVIVNAYHSFPDEYAIVKSQSLIDF